MFKHLTALTLSAAIALTSLTATPARADSEDVAKVLGGLTLLFILGKALEDDRKATVTRHVTPRPTAKPPRKRAKVIPSQCYRELASNGRVVRGYGARCMQNNVRRAGSLPPQCIRKVQTHRGQRHLYRPKCLRQNGWVRS